MGNECSWQWIVGRFCAHKRLFFRIIDVISHAKWWLYNSSSCWNERRRLLRQICTAKCHQNKFYFDCVNKLGAGSSGKMYRDRWKTNKVWWFTASPGAMLSNDDRIFSQELDYDLFLGNKMMRHTAAYYGMLDFNCTFRAHNYTAFINSQQINFSISFFCCYATRFSLN